MDSIIGAGYASDAEYGNRYRSGNPVYGGDADWPDCGAGEPAGTGRKNGFFLFYIDDHAYEGVYT